MIPPPTEARGGIAADDISNGHSSQSAHRTLGGTAHAGAETQKQRSVRAAVHGDTGKCDPSNQCAIRAFNRKPFAAIENAVGDRNVLETSIRFRAQLDTSVKLLREIRLYTGLRCVICWPALPRAVQHGTHFISTGDIAVADRDVLSCACISVHRPALLNGKNSEMLFVSLSGSRIRSDRVGKIIGHWTTAYATQRTTPHMIRDSVAYKWLKEHPKDFLTLSKILWHKNVQTTIRIYGSRFNESSGTCAMEAWLDQRSAYQN